MFNKKGISILLATAMIFSLNSVAFAEEAVVAAEDKVEVEYDQTGGEYSQSYNEDTLSVNEKAVSMNGTTIDATVACPIVSYTGAKITADRLGIDLYDNSVGAWIPAKKIKITDNKKATATGTVKYKITGIYDWRYLTPDDGNYEISNMKAKYKEIKAKLKSIKNVELTAYVEPHYIDDSVSTDFVNSLKKNKSLSNADLKVDGNYVGDTVVVTTKNGNVKKVQLPIVKKKWTLAKDTDGTTFQTAYKLSISLKTLKKGTDYTVSGDVITFKDSASFSGSGSFKSKD